MKENRLMTTQGPIRGLNETNNQQDQPSKSRWHYLYHTTVWCLVLVFWTQPQERALWAFVALLALVIIAPRLNSRFELEIHFGESDGDGGDGGD